MNRKRKVAVEAVLIVAAGILTGVMLTGVSLPDLHFARIPYRFADAADPSSAPARNQIEVPPSHRQSHQHYMGHSITTTPAHASTGNL